MDARVNDFLNEINEIAPLDETKAECVWEKCYDDNSGYYYYWNTKTNEVTWDMPAEYRGTHKTKTKKSNLYIPPRTAPLFPSANVLPPVSEAIKIYKIGECTDSVGNSVLNKSKPASELSNQNEERTVSSTLLQSKADIEDKFEAPVVKLVPFYGEDSESENEPTKEIQKANGSKSSEKSSAANSDEDDLDKFQKKITKLPNVESQVQVEIKQIIGKHKEQTPLKKNETKEKSHFSLVSGYSDSEDETEETSTRNFLIGTPPGESQISHSTLFPVTKPIDIKDFVVSPKAPEGEPGFDTKAFQRKRRIGVALVNTGKRNRVEGDGERRGLGFSNENDEDSATVTNKIYAGFKSGGVMFVKSDVLNPPSSDKDKDIESFGEKSGQILKEIEETCKTLKEKLGFLSEGHEQVLPVQVMLIQIETLHTALKSGNLKQNYLRKWLDETCSDLVKLEKETTPEGWLLQWDRGHKRYYYQNASTGESQWEYPQADVTRCDEAMDICTTPPPNGAEPTIHMSPPLPPIIGSPSPPPPPTISDCKSSKNTKCDIPLPPEQKEVLPVERYGSNGEPLPPGVDSFDVTARTKDVKQNDMSDILTSFYSDIAAIETTDSPPMLSVSEDAKKEVADTTTEFTKKKKKTKVKLAQGISMKKKGVSKLVEKWKNVQMSYNE